MSTISSSTTLTQTLINGYSWPVTISGGTSSTPTVITLGENIILNSATNYFIFSSEYVVFDGAGYTVTIDGVTGYPGLIQNGVFPSTNSFSNCKVQNVGVLVSGGSVLTNSAGWVCQQGFSVNSINNLVTKCYSNGPISAQYCGGICGEAFGQSLNNTVSSNIESSCIISYCYSLGIISGLNSGGICGTISIFAGNLSPSTGNTNSLCVITNCYSLGNISGNNCGGICGSSIAQVFGPRTTASCTISNCYSYGTISGTSAGGIFGSDKGTGATSLNSYIANGSWSNSLASSNLTGVPTSTPIGTSWTKLATNFPWALSAFNANLYNPSTASTSNFTYTSNPGLLTGVSYSAFNSSTSATVTANSSTGALTFKTPQPGTNVSSVIAYKGSISPNIYYGYNINTFTLNFTGSYYSIYNSPLIYTQPLSQISKIGGRVVFQTYAYSLTPITYQWFFNDKPIEGANGLYLVIDPVLQSDAGKYYVIVTNTAGSTKSSDAYLTISKI